MYISLDAIAATYGKLVETAPIIKPDQPTCRETLETVQIARVDVQTLLQEQIEYLNRQIIRLKKQLANAKQEVATFGQNHPDVELARQQENNLNEFNTRALQSLGLNGAEYDVQINPNGTFLVLGARQVDGSNGLTKYDKVIGTYQVPPSLLNLYRQLGGGAGFTLNSKTIANTQALDEIRLTPTELEAKIVKLEEIIATLQLGVTTSQ
jgi:hypothetical protein